MTEMKAKKCTPDDNIPATDSTHASTYGSQPVSVSSIWGLLISFHILTTLINTGRNIFVPESHYGRRKSVHGYLPPTPHVNWMSKMWKHTCKRKTERKGISSYQKYADINGCQSGNCFALYLHYNIMGNWYYCSMLLSYSRNLMRMLY